MSKGNRSQPVTTSRKALTAVSDGRVEGMIRLLCGERVILDSDLAALYGVPTRVLNQAVKRNLDRFPEDFMLQVTGVEAACLKSQTVISKLRRARRTARPHGPRRPARGIRWWGP